jgi:hypothetical protein
VALVLILVEVDPDVCVSGPDRGSQGRWFGGLEKGVIRFYSLNYQKIV